MKQQTLKASCSLSGIGIHSGKKNTLTFHPSDSGHITFRSHQKKLIVSPEACANSHPRATILKNDSLTVATPEHLLSACAGLGITSLDIEIDNEEIPILDGSAKNFIDVFLEVGRQALDQDIDPLIIHSPIHVQNGASIISLLPAEKTSFSYYLHYDDKVIGTQWKTLEWNENNYISEISAARTYGFEHEVKALLDKGLAKGGSLDNALIIGENDYINTPRFDDECVRHKLLDLIGDLWILNRPIQGNIIAVKSGHQLSNTLVQTLSKH